MGFQRGATLVHADRVLKGSLPGLQARDDLLEFGQRLLEAQGRNFTQEPLLIEAPLPPPNWPSWVRMSPKLWGFFSRFFWWFFNHHHGLENRAQAEARADVAAGKLVELAASGQDVVVLAHGFFNVLIGRALRKRGWRMTLREGYKYWSTRRFERP